MYMMEFILMKHGFVTFDEIREIRNCILDRLNTKEFTVPPKKVKIK